MDCSKGEWKYGEDREGKPVVGVYFGSDYRRIHPIVARVFGRTKKEIKANAQLMSAAPNMYGALIQAMRTFQAHGIKETDPRYLKLRQAVAKAEGGEA